MNKLNPKYKICFQNRSNLVHNLNIYKLCSKKWNILKNQIRYSEEDKVLKKEYFFKKRLLETQQFRYFYGCIHSYQLRNLRSKLLRKDRSVNSLTNFISALESRIDVNLVRLKFVKTIFQARQIINHGRVRINHKKIKKPSFILRRGDMIYIVRKKRYGRRRYL